MSRLIAAGRGLAVCVAGLIGLATASEAGAQARQLERAKIKVGISITDSTFLPIYLAQEQGYFKEEGLDATFSTFNGGSDLIRAVISDSADIGLSSPAAVFSAIKADQDVRIFFGGFTQAPFSLCAIPSIKTLADAKGKRFGITRFGSSTDELTRYMLKAQRIDPDKDVKIVQGGGSSARLAAMEAGQLDVALFAMPFDFIAASKGYNVLVRQTDVMPDFPIQSFFARQRYIASHRDTIEALLRAFVRGVRLAKANKAMAVQTLIDKVYIDKQFAEQAYASLIGGWHEDGLLASDAGMKAFFDMAVASGHLDAPWPKEKYWDNQFVASFDQWKPR
jgi:NitT/TauT family transport system substrate-binding protein